MQIEPIPDDILPQRLIDAVLRGPEIDPQTGKYVGGVYSGMTPDEVIADREAYNRACGE